MGKIPFAAKTLTFRERYFVAVKEGFVFNPEVRQHVSFARDNVLDDGFLSGRAPYDFIFCRNLLIYFDRATQVVALAKLNRLLAADGVLFVGPAEMPLVSESGFTSANFPHAFACRKTNGRAARCSGPCAAASRALRLRPAPPATEPPALPAPHRQRSPPRTPCSGAPTRRRGPARGSRRHCEAHLTTDATSAEAYYLLGLVKDAANDLDAMIYYRKALYLDPNHYETLVHAHCGWKRPGMFAALNIPPPRRATARATKDKNRMNENPHQHRSAPAAEF